MDRLKLLVSVANEKYDGHFTIMKFTNNWRVSFGPTPNDREMINNMPLGDTLDEAIINALIEEL